jgi:hypothetical protein
MCQRPRLICLAVPGYVCWLTLNGLASLIWLSQGLPLSRHLHRGRREHNQTSAPRPPTPRRCTHPLRPPAHAPAAHPLHRLEPCSRPPTPLPPTTIRRNNAAKNDDGRATPAVRTGPGRRHPIQDRARQPKIGWNRKGRRTQRQDTARECNLRYIRTHFNRTQQ